MMTRCGIRSSKFWVHSRLGSDAGPRASILGDRPKARVVVEPLVAFLDEFKKVARGDEPNEKFWDSFYKFQSVSGGDVVTGNIRVLFPYLQASTESGWRASESVDWREGYGSIRNKDIPSSLSTVPFNWTYFDTTLDMNFTGGLFAVS